MKNNQLVHFVIGIILFASLGCTSTIENQLFFVQEGKGEPVIFIHGAQEDYRVFMPQIELLKEDFRVISYSRRFNFPKPNLYRKDDPYNVKTEADDLETLINSLNIKSCHIVGHSFGGLVAMEYTHNNQDKVLSLSLSEPPLLRLAGCEEWYQVAQKGLIENVGTAFNTKDTTQVMAAIFKFFVGADIQDQVPPEVLQSLIDNLAEMNALVNSDDPFPDLSTNFQIPVMLITAGNTMPMLNCTNEALIKKMPAAIHKHIPNASHEMWMTHPEILSEYLRNFISGKMEGKNSKTKRIENE